MTDNKAQFLYLLNCFLNGKIPDSKHYDWQGIYKLSSIHNTTAIITQTAKLLPKECQPSGEIRSAFNQQLGLTLLDYDKKCSAIDKIKTILNANAIDYIIVKGAVLSDFYSIPQLRTSGDIDVILRSNAFDDNIAALMNQGINLIHDDYYTKTFEISDCNIEMHRDADVDNKYFDDIFSLCRVSGCEYSLDDYHHLLYIVCHLCKHLAYTGAGVRMLADIDVLVRHIDNFDEAKFLALCQSAGIEYTAKIILTLCNLWFDTPIASKIQLDENTLHMFVRVMLDGGVFGLEQSNLGGYLVAKNSHGRLGAFGKIMALFKWVFPSAEYVRTYYDYSRKHRFLIPLAYLNRIFDAVFKRRKHTAKTTAQIFQSNELPMIQSELINTIKKRNEN